MPPDQSMPAIYGLINAERAKHGLKALASDGGLAARCRTLTADNNRTGVLAHTKVPPPRAPWGEIIGYGAPNWAAQLDAWMASDVHREIILDPAYTIFGAAQTGAYRCVQFLH